MAVEEREKDETVQKTVDIETLLSEIRVDNLPYVGFSQVPKHEVEVREYHENYCSLSTSRSFPGRLIRFDEFLRKEFN